MWIKLMFLIEHWTEVKHRTVYVICYNKQTKKLRNKSLDRLDKRFYKNGCFGRQ